MACASLLAVGTLCLVAMLGEGRRVDVKAVMSAMRRADAGQVPSVSESSSQTQPVAAVDISKSHVVFENSGQMIIQIESGLLPGAPPATVTNVVGAPAQPQQASSQPELEKGVPQALVATSSQLQVDSAARAQQIKEAEQVAAREVKKLVVAMGKSGVLRIPADTSESNVVFENTGEVIFQLQTLGLPPVTIVVNASSQALADQAAPATKSQQQPDAAASQGQQVEGAEQPADISESLIVFKNSGQLIFQIENFLPPWAPPATSVTNAQGQPQVPSAQGLELVIPQGAIAQALANVAKGAAAAAAADSQQQQPQAQPQEEQ